eukprot:11226148-Lingulodinium_polyedra.AAC.1
MFPASRRRCTSKGTRRKTSLLSLQGSANRPCGESAGISASGVQKQMSAGSLGASPQRHGGEDGRRRWSTWCG